jgi:hypothetical protein
MFFADIGLGGTRTDYFTLGNVKSTLSNLSYAQNCHFN